LCSHVQFVPQQTNLLPPESLDDAGLTANFARYDFSNGYGHFGLDLKTTIVTLSGAHTIGKARVTDKSPSSFGLGALSSSPDKFDGSYYTEVTSVDGYKGRQGWFASVSEQL
jgi:Peroxidase